MPKNKEKVPLDTRKSVLNLACEYLFQIFAHQPVFLMTRQQDGVTIVFIELRRVSSY